MGEDQGQGKKPNDQEKENFDGTTCVCVYVIAHTERLKEASWKGVEAPKPLSKTHITHPDKYLLIEQEEKEKSAKITRMKSSTPYKNKEGGNRGKGDCAI